MAFVIIASESMPKKVGLESLVLTPDAVGIQSVMNATRPGIASSKDTLRKLESIHQNILKITHPSATKVLALYKWKMAQVRRCLFERAFLEAN